ncbi:hypothetical protein IMAU20035_01563 [Lactobacillus helveticus]|nr:hypothetical protein [Lactobacillus helveticus]
MKMTNIQSFVSMMTTSNKEFIHRHMIPVEKTLVGLLQKMAMETYKIEAMEA